MRSVVQFLGVVLVAVGISGTVDRLLGHQPIMGFLNVVNRLVIPQVEVLTGSELYANLAVVGFGAAVVAAARAVPA